MSDSEEEKTEKPKYSLRELTIEEIINSEVKYVKKLTDLEYKIHIYLKEKKYRDKKKAAPEKNLVSSMHMEIIQILELSKKLVNSLVKNKEAVGEIFKEYGPFFKLYTTYMERCELYMATFRMYKCECAYKSTMASLMIAPVQRIPRYQLLLRDLMNRTSQTHSDYKNIEEAMKLVMSIAGSINEQMRLMNQRQEYQELFFLRFRNSSLKYPDKDLFDDQELKKLDPMKCLLKKTNALKVTTNDSTNRVEIFLTESHFAYSHEGSNRLVRAIPISKLEIDSSVTASHITKIDEEYLHWNKFPLLINNPPPLRSIMLLFPSEDERDMWSFIIDQQKKKLNTPEERRRRSTLSVSNQRKSSMFKGDAAHAKWSLAAQIFATVQSSGKDKMYEYVKKEIRARYGKDAINDKNKHKLKSLAIAAPFCSFSRENQHPKWELASKMFAEKPFSNGHDKRYEEVKAIIRKKFGESAINESNKARLKALALAGKQSKDLQAVGAHPKWKLAQDMFSRSPYSNGNDYRYEAVKNEIRFRWGKKSITDKDKPLLKALAVAAPYFVDMDVAEDSEMSKPSLTSSPSRAKSVVGAGVWIPDTSAFIRIPHHCRKCGYCVCSKCSPHRIVVVLNEPPQRVCDYCVNGAKDQSSSDIMELASKGKSVFKKSMSED